MHIPLLSVIFSAFFQTLSTAHYILVTLCISVRVGGGSAIFATLYTECRLFHVQGLDPHTVTLLHPPHNFRTLSSLSLITQYVHFFRHLVSICKSSLLVTQTHLVSPFTKHMYILQSLSCFFCCRFSQKLCTARSTHIGPTSAHSSSSSLPDTYAYFCWLQF
jgi:hypothetical protein